MMVWDPNTYLELVQALPPRSWIRALLALALVAVLVPVLAPLAMRLGLTDHPGGRKQHEAPTAMHGGLCIVIALLACSLLFHDLNSRAMLTLYAAGGMLLLVGLVDDRHDLNWRVRIGAQVIAALLIAVVGGASVHQLGDVVGVPGLELNWLSLPVTVFVVVGVINALNMSDGVDGLAASQALVSFLLFTAFALYAGNIHTAERLLAVAGAIVGFLVWNLRRPGLPRARVFLGDAGSMVLGFGIAWAAVRLSQDPAHPVSPVLGPWTIAIPLIDCVSLIFRRLRQGRSPFAADRDHFHHLLLDAGYSPAVVTLGLMMVSALLGVLAAVALKLGVYRPLLVLAFLVLIAVHYRLTLDRDRTVAWLAGLPLLPRGRTPASGGPESPRQPA